MSDSECSNRLNSCLAFTYKLYGTVSNFTSNLWWNTSLKVEIHRISGWPDNLGFLISGRIPDLTYRRSGQILNNKIAGNTAFGLAGYLAGRISGRISIQFFEAKDADWSKKDFETPKMFEIPSVIKIPFFALIATPYEGYRYRRHL
jgi:hypothetical protein